MIRAPKPPQSYEGSCPDCGAAGPTELCAACIAAIPPLRDDAILGGLSIRARRQFHREAKARRRLAR